MKICVYGAGAIGGYLATKLINSGHNVHVIARGENLASIKNNGLTVLYESSKEHAFVKASSEPPNEKQDYVFVATKTTSLFQIAPNLQKLASNGSVLIPLMNGIPHWYFFGMDSIWQNKRIDCLDPEGIISNTIPWEQIIATVVYPACELIGPGVIKHTYGNRFSLGEITGEKTRRILNLSSLLYESGLKAPIRKDIRSEIWVKLLGNLALNAVSALTSSTIEQILDNPKTECLIKKLMLETESVAKAHGIKFPITIEKRIEGARQVGNHKTSMLQDLETGREMEIDSIISAVQELGTYVNKETPTIDTILALLKQRAALANCYQIKK